jgi:aconitate decarboxylase
VSDTQVAAADDGVAVAALRTFASWAAGLEFDQLPEPVVTRIKQSVRDGLGCAVFGSTLAWANIVADTVASQSNRTGPATVWGTGTKVDVLPAAIANGTALQSYELDDLHAEASLHGSSAMLPALLTLAESRGGVTGRDLLTALAVGWEAGVRVNRTVGHILVYGWHPPTIMGTIAAAAAAGRLLRLDAQKMYHCLSLGILQASGLTAVQYGGMAKRLYAGRAAEVGALSAMLAEKGFTAPDDVFGHPVGGFLHSFAPGRDYDLDAMSRDLGKKFAASGISFKLYSCCAASHPALDAVGELLAEEGVSADTVDLIELELTEHGYKHVGFRYVPGNAVTGQFSIEYCVAAYLLEGAVFVEQFRDELLDDSRIMDIVGRIKTSIDATLEDKADLRTKRAVRVRFTLRDGTVLQREAMLARGHADLPATDDQLRAKFNRLAKVRMNTGEAEHLSELCARLDGLNDAVELVRALNISESG